MRRVWPTSERLNPALLNFGDLKKMFVVRGWTVVGPPQALLIESDSLTVTYRAIELTATVLTTKVTSKLRPRTYRI